MELMLDWNPVSDCKIVNPVTDLVTHRFWRTNDKGGVLLKRPALSSSSVETVNFFPSVLVFRTDNLKVYYFTSVHFKFCSNWF